MRFLKPDFRKQWIRLLGFASDELQQLGVVRFVDVDHAGRVERGESLGLILGDEVPQLDAGEVALGAARGLVRLQDWEDAAVEDCGRVGVRQLGFQLRRLGMVLGLVRGVFVRFAV